MVIQAIHKVDIVAGGATTHRSAPRTFRAIPLPNEKCGCSLRPAIAISHVYDDRETTMEWRIGLLAALAFWAATPAVSWVVYPGGGRASLAQDQTSGAGDFDWEMGLWDTSVRVRAPLDPDAAWAKFEGTSDVRPVSNGRANTVDLALVGPEGARIDGLGLRLFNPKVGQWSLNFASMRDGMLTAPVYGHFAGGRGVFHGQDTIAGRVVMVRFVISDITPNSARFVQSYSSDGGTTWIDNWIATDTRRAEANGAPAAGQLSASR